MLSAKLEIKHRISNKSALEKHFFKAYKLENFETVENVELVGNVE